VDGASEGAPPTAPPRIALPGPLPSFSVGETSIIDIPVPVLLDGQAVKSSTCATSAGAYTLIFDTVIPDRGIHLHTTYTGHRAAQTHAVHLMLAPGRRESIHAEHDHDTLPVTHARRTCLYDHLQRLQDFLTDLGHQASIALDEKAIEAAEA
jgi:hypothetical protein